MNSHQDFYQQIHLQPTAFDTETYRLSSARFSMTVHEWEIRTYIHINILENKILKEHENIEHI